MRIVKEDSEYRRLVTVYPFDDGDAGRVRVERSVDFGSSDWGPVEIHYGCFSPVNVERARAHAEAILEGCRIAEEMSRA